jgi:hypothetical protein
MFNIACGNIGLFVYPKINYSEEIIIMLQNIFVGFMAVVIIGAGIYGWLIDNGKDKEDKEDKENKEPK